MEKPEIDVCPEDQMKSVRIGVVDALKTVHFTFFMADGREISIFMHHTNIPPVMEKLQEIEGHFARRV